MLRCSLLSFGLLAWMVLGMRFAARAAEATFFPCEPGPGSLLFFVRPEGPGGKPLAGDDHERHESVYVWSAGGAQPPQPVMRCQARLPEFLHRVSRSVVLMHHEEHLQLLDLATGQRERVGKGEEPTDFLRADGRSLLFLRHFVAKQFAGYRLKSDASDHVVLDQWHRPKDALCAVVPGAEPKELIEPLVEQILLQDETGFWLVTAESRPHLLHVTLKGEVTDKLPWQPDWAACEARIKLSPDGRNIALSILRLDQDFHKLRDLVLMNRAKARVTHVIYDMDCGGMALFSSTPALRLEWQDDHALRIGMSFFKDDKLLNLDTLKLSPAPAPAEAAPQDKPGVRKTVGKFQTVHGKVWFGREAKVAGSVLDENGAWTSASLEFSPDSRWAALASPGLDAVLALDGETKTRRTLINGWSYNLKWLPASEAAPPAAVKP